MELSEARRRLAAVIAKGRPEKERVAVHCRNGQTRYKTVLGPPIGPRLWEALDQEAAALGAEIARLERLRGPQEPRMTPRISQVKPSLRPDRQARTPRTGRWGFGLTPTFQGRRSAPASKLALSTEWANLTTTEVAEPCLKVEARKPEEHTHGGFATKAKRGKHKSRRRALKMEMKFWADEFVRKELARKQKEEAKSGKAD